MSYDEVMDFYVETKYFQANVENSIIKGIIVPEDEAHETVVLDGTAAYSLKSEKAIDEDFIKKFNEHCLENEKFLNVETLNEFARLNHKNMSFIKIPRIEYHRDCDIIIEDKNTSLAKLSNLLKMDYIVAFEVYDDSQYYDFDHVELIDLTEKFVLYKYSKNQLNWIDIKYGTKVAKLDRGFFILEHRFYFNYDYGYYIKNYKALIMYFDIANIEEYIKILPEEWKKF